MGRFKHSALRAFPRLFATEPFVQTPIRFPPSLLARIDRAAKKRGLNRSSWIRYAATKELDIEEL